MNNKLTKQDKESLGNKTVFFSSVTLSYALLLLFIQKMASSSMTIDGAIALINLLRWVSLCGAMACAAWSAYKEKKGFFMYCAMCIFVFFSTTTLLFVPSSRSYLINYCALFFAFVMAQVYYALKVRGMFEKGSLWKKLFLAACLLAIAIATVLCVASSTFLSLAF